LGLLRAARQAEHHAGAVFRRPAKEARSWRARGHGRRQRVQRLPDEGSGPNGIFKSSPNPNAAKLFQAFCLGREAQQLIIDVGGLRSVHPDTQEKAGRKPLKDIKTMKDDAAAVEKESDAIKVRYTKIFHV